MAEREDSEDPARLEGRRRFGKLPERAEADEWVESVTTAPLADDDYDPDVDAVWRFGL